MSDVPIFYNLETAGDVTAITGELSDLTTTTKTNLVAAINELDSNFPVSIANGGTNATTADGALTNLGVTTLTGSLTDLTTTSQTNLVAAINEINGKFPVAIASGGTGATTATLARTNLGVMTQTDLYYNVSGSDTSIELNDSIVNYDHIGVYYYSESSVSGCSFYTEFPTSQSSVLLCAVRSNDARTSLLCKSVKTDWVTNTVTFTAPTEVQIKTSSVTFAESHGIKIFKVIGYKF